MKNSNQTHWSPDMDGSGFAVRRHQELRLHAGQLSSREMEVLQLVAEGKANKKPRGNLASASRPLRSIASISWRILTSMIPPVSPATPSVPESLMAESN